MLQVVSIRKKDIIVTSPGYDPLNSTNETSGNLGADRIRDDF